MTAVAVLLSLACSSPAPPSKPAVPQPAPQGQQSAANSAAEPAGDRPRIAMGVTVGVSSNPAGAAPVVVATARPPAQVVPTATQAPPPTAVAVAPAAPANTDEATLRFQTPLTSTAEIDAVADALKRMPGIVDVRASTESMTVRYDTATLSPDELRALLAATQWPVEP